MHTSAKNRFKPVSRRFFSRGVTLIELMVVVTVAGALAAVAIPAYNDYVKKARAQEATNALTGARMRMEQYYQDARSYLPVAGLAYPANTCPMVATKNFTYACNNISATTYRLVANGIGAQGMGAFQFTINQAGAQTSNFDGTAGGTCWLNRKGGTC